MPFTVGAAKILGCCGTLLLNICAFIASINIERSDCVTTSKSDFIVTVQVNVRLDPTGQTLSEEG